MSFKKRFHEILLIFHVFIFSLLTENCVLITVLYDVNQQIATHENNPTLRKPPRKRKSLIIINPETNEEISVSQENSKLKKGIMAHETDLERRFGHVTVCMEHYILVIGGWWFDKGPLPSTVIWMYNLYTEQWRKHVMIATKKAPDTIYSACAVNIGMDIYIFGGKKQLKSHQTNALWKLSKTDDACFSWNEIVTRNKRKAPSPRSNHSGWDYGKKFYVFGGHGPSTLGYLNDNGDFDHCCNNQLLCFNPKNKKWTNPRTFGKVPPPRECHATSIIKNKVYLYGGEDSTHVPRDEMYELNMFSVTWYQIHVRGFKPKKLHCFSLNNITESQLVLHGGATLDDKSLSNTWIYNIPSKTWRQHMSQKDHPRDSHTGTTGVNSSVIIIGGGNSEELNDTLHSKYTTTFNVMLEPKNLQQFALQTIKKNQSFLPWENLPRKLILLLEIEAPTDMRLSAITQC